MAEVGGIFVPSNGCYMGSSDQLFLIVREVNVATREMDEIMQ